MVRLSRRQRVTFSLLVQRRSNQEESTPEWRDTSPQPLRLGPPAALHGFLPREPSRTSVCATLSGRSPQTQPLRGAPYGVSTLRTATTTAATTATPLFASGGTAQMGFCCCSC